MTTKYFLLLLEFFYNPIFLFIQTLSYSLIFLSFTKNAYVVNLFICYNHEINSNPDFSNLKSMSPNIYYITINLNMIVIKLFQDYKLIRFHQIPFFPFINHTKTFKYILELKINKNSRLTLGQYYIHNYYKYNGHNPLVKPIKYIY